MPKAPFHQTFPRVINRLANPAAARIVQMIGNCADFAGNGIDTVDAWGIAMVRLGLGKSSVHAGNPHDFIPESGGTRKPLHEVLLHIIPRIQSEAELCFVQTLINVTEIPEAGRGAIVHAWQLQLEKLADILDIDAADYAIGFDHLPETVPAAAKLARAA